MSLAHCVMESKGFVLLDHKNRVIDLKIWSGYSLDYEPVTIIEGVDYFDRYLNDNIGVFSNKFSGVVTIDLIDIKLYGYELVSIDLNLIDDNSLPWFHNQRVVHTLLKADHIPQKFDIMSTKPKDMEVYYDVRKRLIKVNHPTVGKRGVMTFEV